MEQLGERTGYGTALSNSIFKHLHRTRRTAGKKKIQSIYLEVLSILINACWAFGQELLKHL